MSDQDRQNHKDTITNNIKDGAGALFHATHKALEATENTAMGAVDATSKTIKNVTGNNDSHE
ncbi:hypothetical protein FZC84_07355 [Rossellomorea vietnamensis]|uniref:Uncharacterized protein n=1 Tax=Rossellomorea vietnamensis TaxID=218284 RepID=A0A5D4MEM4_9BACI|nr:hypothetical protein [Rossellomorea vietnamensis]TYS00350.1 hypothetical protein FZC84_07355 [Rossellomorea vietnamensis]